MGFPKYWIVIDNSRSKIINDNRVTKLDASSPADHDKSDDSGNAKIFLKEFSRQYEFRDKSLLISINADFGMTSDSLEEADNGKWDDWCHVNKVSTKSDHDKK
jgi:hypothetical protein